MFTSFLFNNKIPKQSEECQNISNKKHFYGLQNSSYSLVCQKLFVRGGALTFIYFLLDLCHFHSSELREYSPSGAK